MASKWYLDTGYYLDEDHDAVLAAETEFSSAKEQLEMHLATDRYLEMRGYLDGIVRHSVSLDLLPLIPRKFHSSDILQEFVREAGVQFGEFLTKIRDIPDILNPNVITDPTYLRHLGYLIGVVFPPEDETSINEMRKTLSEAVDWYKIKGTYRALAIIAYISGLTVNFYDMYTNDYVSFLPVDWFVGDEGENPPGFDSSYYKSPHFGMEVLLNKIYSASTGESGASGETAYNYLWRPPYINSLALQVEEVRPVHTVPHFSILLNPQTDEFGHIIEVEGEIKAKVTSDWQFGIKYFDPIGSDQIWNFDDEDIFFDSSEGGFIKTILKYKLGTGDGGVYSSFPALQNIVYEGSIDPSDITLLSDRYRFEFVVPKNVELSNISELGLYIPNSPDTLVVVSNFPKIIKDKRLSLRVLVEVFKQDLRV